MSSSCYLPEVMGYSPKYPVYPEDLGSDLKKHDLKRALINKRASSHPRRPMCQTPPTLCDIWDLLSEFFFFFLFRYCQHLASLSVDVTFPTISASLLKRIGLTQSGEVILDICVEEPTDLTFPLEVSGNNQLSVILWCLFF